MEPTAKRQSLFSGIGHGERGIQPGFEKLKNLFSTVPPRTNGAVSKNQSRGIPTLFSPPCFLKAIAMNRERITLKI